VNVDTASAFCRDFDAVLTKHKISLRRAEELSGWGKTTIASARRGTALPNKDLVQDVLEAIGLSAAEVESWMARYARIEKGGPDQVEPAGSEGAPARFSLKVLREHRWRLVVLVVVGVVVGLAVGLAVGGVFDEDPQATDATASDPPAGSKAIVVQNKVAIGATTLEEDDSPSYLSSRTVSRCANIGCKLTGTDIYSGSKLTAYCQTPGEWLTNADLGSEGIKQNPGLVASDLWYGIEWRDGRRGFISEVYIEPSYRGGLNLAAC